jgi:predicted NAD-dependent protein-ADP-ribosyltransferase YbiA (DUF1768 family)
MIAKDVERLPTIVEESKVQLKFPAPLKNKLALRPCQLCKNICKSKDYTDLVSEEEGAAWAFCASCLASLFPSLLMKRQPRPVVVKLGATPKDWLWELSPRSCIPLKWRGSTWPSAYHAVASEMFSDSAIRQEIYKAFDAEELDNILRDSKILRSVKPQWDVERVAKVRGVLRAKADGHPLLKELLKTLSHQKITYFQVSPDVEKLVWGDGGDLIATVNMELVDDHHA